MPAQDEEQIECSRCGRFVPVGDAGMLSQKDNKALWRYLCESCLKEVGVPQGYVLKRDLSHLAIPAEEETPSEEEQIRSETEVIADFEGRVITAESSHDELTPGRVLLNRFQVVLVTDVDLTRIPLSKIHDISQGQISETAQEYFDDVLRIIFEIDGTEQVAFIEGSSDALAHFVPLLFKAILNGSSARLKHAVNIGGRPRDPEVRRGLLELGNESIHVRNLESAVRFSFEEMVNADLRVRDWCSSSDTVLLVTIHRNGSTVLSECELPTDRLLNLALRYLRQQISSRRGSIAGVPISEAELEALTGLYAWPEIDVESLLTGEDGTVSTILSNLEEKGLIEGTDSDRILTLNGLAVVQRRFSEVE